VLREGAIPEHSKKEGSDQDIEEEHERFCDHIRLVFSLNDFLEHFTM